MFDEHGFRWSDETLQLSGNIERERGEIDFNPFEAIATAETTGLPETGVRGLLLAVLQDGIRCYFSPLARVRAEAEHWVESSLQRTAFSFPVLCELFGIDAAAARRSLRQLRSSKGIAVAHQRRRVCRGGQIG